MGKLLFCRIIHNYFKIQSTKQNCGHKCGTISACTHSLPRVHLIETVPSSQELYSVSTLAIIPSYRSTSPPPPPHNYNCGWIGSYVLWHLFLGLFQVIFDVVEGSDACPKMRVLGRCTKCLVDTSTVWHLVLKTNEIVWTKALVAVNIIKTHKHFVLLSVDGFLF